ncbi:ATP-binding protein [Candidatus Woesearchaeota archaeon]|nr:ATP-binding protein [Candidatus Woesearchaeota archaeon]
MEKQDFFEEWTTYAHKKILRERDLDFKSIIRNSELKLIALTGIRRAGKSSVLMLLAQKLSKEGKKVAYINLEDSRIKGDPAILDEILKWFGGEGFLLLDEITSAQGWSGWLARTHELLKGTLRIIVSSSRSGLMFPYKPLRGRILSMEMYPLSFKEFLNFKSITAEKTTIGKGRIETALKEYLRFGGFPEVALTETELDRINLLNSYFRDIIGLDVAEAAHEDLSIVENFGRYIIESTSFSASKCLNFFKTLGYKIGKEKILALEHYSQESYLFFFNEIFSYNIKNRLQYPRQCYLGDTGFAYAISGKTDLGKLFENMVFLELKRKLPLHEICYWKNAAGREVDFVIKKGADIHSLIQVAYTIETKETKEREVKALIECAEELGKKKGIIITKNINDTVIVDGISVTILPLMEWLTLSE